MKEFTKAHQQQALANFVEQLPLGLQAALQPAAEYEPTGVDWADMPALRIPTHGSMALVSRCTDLLPLTARN